MRIAAGIITYNDKPSLMRCLRSIYSHMDVIIVVDGRYPAWGTPDMSKFSTDGTKELCEKLRKVDYYELYAEQPEKRSKYLEVTKKHDCDLLLVIDADDYIHTDTNWELFHQYIEQNVEGFELMLARNKPVVNVKFIMTPPPNIRTDGIGRLFYKPYNMRYISHWKLIRLDKDGIEARYPIRNQLPFVPGLVITTDDMRRPITRVETDIDYQWKLMLDEGSITEKEYNNPLERDKFSKSINNEVYVWEKYYKDKNMYKSLVKDT